MAFKIEETFRVQAPAEQVWRYLIDPQRVVHCLPGAELVETRGDGTLLGRVRVKIGPVSAAYKGTARFLELDEAARRVRLSGEGQEAGGSGSARMTMSSEMDALPDGGTEVRVTAEIDVAGRIVQFGRGMIEEVSRELFRQFASCVQAELERAEAEPPVAAGGFGTAGAGPAPPASGAGGAMRVTPALERSPINGVQLLLRAAAAWLRRLLGRARSR